MANPALSEQDWTDKLTQPELPIGQKVDKTFVLFHNCARAEMREIERIRPNAIPEQFVNGASIKLATPMHFIRAIRCFKQTWEKALSQ